MLHCHPLFYSVTYSILELSRPFFIVASHLYTV
uniref:Uncharacterized protein n=1 Tax=Anguilla anguilla TaxID=7936 RepID=A0A0E9V4Y2_ANGAN